MSESGRSRTALTVTKDWIGDGFPIAYLIYTCLSCAGYVSEWMPVRALAVVVIAWGSVKALISLRRVFRAEYRVELILFAAFFLSFAASSLLNAKYGILDNLKTMVWLGLCMFVTYFCGLTERERPGKRPLYEWFFYVLMVFTTVMALIGIGMWIKGYGRYINKDTIHGFLWGRLWGMYKDPNYGSILSAVSISAALMFLALGKEKHPRRGILVLHILIVEGYIVGAYSRGARLVMLVTTAIFYLYYCICMKKSLRRKLVTGALLILLLALPWLVRAGYNQLAEWHNQRVAEEIRQAEEAGLDPSELDIDEPMEEMEREESTTGSFSIRFGIWKDGWKLFRTSPVYGISYRNIQAYARQNEVGRYVQKSINTMHNVVMDVTVSQGLVGLAIFVLAAAVFAVRILRGWLVFTPKEREEAMLFLLPMATVVGGALTLSDIIYMNTPTTVVFWTMLGQLMRLYHFRAVPRLKKKKEFIKKKND